MTAKRTRSLAARAAKERQKKSEAFIAWLRSKYVGQTILGLSLERCDIDGEHTLVLSFSNGSVMTVTTDETPGEPFAARLLVDGIDYENPGNVR